VPAPLPGAGLRSYAADMAETHVPNVATLYHGTSSTAAVEIIGGGAICPPASSPELAKRYLLPNAPLADQRCVYLIPTAHEAIMFGVARAIGLKWKRGVYKINAFSTRKDYDCVVIFEVDANALNPALVRKSSLYENEVAYEGVVDLGDIVRGVEFPVTRELYEFARDIQTPQLLKQYVGMDLTEHLQGEPFALDRSRVCKA
jgi:hypothetical protein